MLQRLQRQAGVGGVCFWLPQRPAVLSEKSALDWACGAAVIRSVLSTTQGAAVIRSIPGAAVCLPVCAAMILSGDDLECPF